MGRVSFRRAGAVAVACAALVVAGCSGDRDTSEGRKIESVVKRFALSHGPDACDLLTTKAVATVYGHTLLDARASKANCVAKSKRFSGEAVDVTFVKVSSATGAHATAKTLDGRRFYSVGLQKQRGRWRIDSITQAQRPG
jgi:hypothetical protein